MEEKCRMVFTIPEKLPSLNQVIQANRGNRFAGAQMKKKIEKDLSGYIAQAVHKGTLRIVRKPCEVYIVWHERTKKRDVDNVQSAQKFILDALVRRGVLPNDSPRWVRQIHHYVQYDGVDGVEVKIEEESE